MALIALAPGEVFSHTHDTVSTTQLVRGIVDLTFNGVTVRLTAVPVAIPAYTVHTMHNVGTHAATIACSYGGGG